MWRVLRRLGMVVNWLFWRKDLWLSNVHKSLGSVLQTAGGVGAREPDARGRRPQPQWPRLGWPSDWPERIIHTMWLLAYVTLKLIESQKNCIIEIDHFHLSFVQSYLGLGQSVNKPLIFTSTVSSMFSPRIKVDYFFAKDTRYFPLFLLFTT